MIKPIQIAFVFILLASVGCRSTRGVSDGLNHNKRKIFEQHFYDAAKHKVLNNNEKALQSYKKALEIYPESHATMYQLAKLYYQLNKYSEALVWAEESVKHNPDYNKWYMGQLAQFYNRFGKYTESAKIFEQMIAQEPEVRKYYIEAANQHFNAGKTEESIGVLKNMQDKFGIEEISSSRLEYIYNKQGKNELAILEMEKLVNRYPENIAFQGYLANALIRAGKVDEGIQVLEKIKLQDPNNGLAHFALHELYGKQGKKKESFENLKIAFSKDDISIQQKLQSISRYFLVLKSSISARQELNELSDILLETYPNSLEPYVLKADYYGTLDNIYKAREFLLKGLEVDETDFRVWTKLLSANAKIGDPRVQVIDAGRAIEIFPNNPGLYAAKGYAQLDVKQFEESIETVNEGLDIAFEKQDKLELMLCKASALNELKRFREADKVFEEVIELSPSNAVAINNFAYSLAERGERIEFADSLCDKALKLDATNPYFMDTKAWILYKKGDYEGAIEWLNKAMLLNPKDIETLEHAKSVYLKLGNQSMVNEIQSKIDLLKRED